MRKLKAISYYRRQVYGAVAGVCLLDAGLFAIVARAFSGVEGELLWALASAFFVHAIASCFAIIFILHRALGPLKKLGAYLGNIGLDPEGTSPVLFRNRDYIKEIEPALGGLHDRLKQRDGRKGESLIMVVVAAAIGMIVLLGIIAGITSSQKGARSVSDNLDLVEAATRARMVLSSEISCTASLNHVDNSAVKNATIGSNLGALRGRSLKLFSAASTSATPVVQLAEGDELNGLKIVAIKFKDVDASDLGNGSVLAELVITGEKKSGTSIGAQRIDQSLVMNIAYDDTTQKPIRCTANSYNAGLECYTAAYGYGLPAGTTHSSPAVAQPALVAQSPATPWPAGAVLTNIFTPYTSGSMGALEPAVTGPTYFSAGEPWGLRCNSGWTATGCNAYDSAYLLQTNAGDPVEVRATRADGTWTTRPLFDHDIALAGNGCFSDSEERERGGRLVLTCCRLKSL